MATGEVSSEMVIISLYTTNHSSFTFTFIQAATLLHTHHICKEIWQISSYVYFTFTILVDFCNVQGYCQTPWVGVMDEGVRST